ncbi:putative T7SS-secreted protein [Streptomyces sp. NPDC057555]|uniref:putative T7SS-secreted protein n=1 Tax=Streptomyces sp. NPDC057555 TaxID=3346166 RepID=UPI0036B8C680
MTAELGETTDPKELIPGNAGTLEAVAGTLRKHSGTFEDVGNRLGGVRISDWSGKASDEFWESFSGEKKKWLYASDAMSDAASTVSKYATALSAAQQQAAEAIELWLDGDKDQAQTTLQNARQYLHDEGQAAGKKLADLAGGASDAPDWLDRASKTAEQQKETGKSTREWKTWHESKELHKREGNERGSKGWQARTEQQPDQRPGGKSWEAKLWERKGEEKVWGKEASGEKQFGEHGKVSGKVEIKTLGVEGTVGVSAKDGNLEAKLGGSAYLAKGSAEAGVDYGAASAKVDGSAFAGAEASTTASIGNKGAHLGAEAFAGAKATVGAHADVGGIGAGVNAEGWAGVGAHANLDAGMKGDKFVIGGSVGVGLGLGGKIGGQIEIDTGKITDTVEDVADAVGDGLEAVGHGLKSLNPFG